MPSVLQLDKMTVSDKLRTLETIWDDLQRTAQDIPAPVWHGDVLKAREERVRQGKSQASEWAEARQRLEKHLS